MIEEAYVSFEIAKLLKEKDFNEACEHQYYVIDEKLGTYNTTDRSRNPERYIDAPTHQMVMAWLREVHNIMIEIYLPYEYEHEEEIWDGKYCFELYSLINGHSIFWDETEYNTYEDAVEAALKYCLEDEEINKSETNIIPPEEVFKVMNKDGWVNIGDGLKMDENGNIVGGLKINKL